MITLAGIRAKERWEGYRKGRDYKGGPTVTKQYALFTDDGVNTAVADLFVDALLGTASVSGGVGGVITRIIPHRCPENPALFCLSAYYEGAGEIGAPGGNTPEFSGYVVTATYGIPPYSFEPDDGNNNFPGGSVPYAEDSLEWSTEVVERPKGSYIYQTAPQLPIDVGTPIFVGRQTYKRTVKNVPFLPVALFNSLNNTLNDATFWGVPRGQLRFVPGNTARSPQNDGTVTQDCDIVIEWRQYDWNKVPRRDTGVWDYAIQAGGGSNMTYTYADWSALSVLWTGQFLEAG